MEISEMNIEQLEAQYAALTRNMDRGQILEVEGDPTIRPEDSDFVAVRKATYRRLVELKHGVVIPNNGGPVHFPV